MTCCGVFRDFRLQFLPPLSQCLSSVVVYSCLFMSAVPSLPTAFYVDAGYYVLEREFVLAAEWLLVTHESRLTNTGDYVTAEIVGA